MAARYKKIERWNSRSYLKSYNPHEIFLDQDQLYVRD